MSSAGRKRRKTSEKAEEGAQNDTTISSLHDKLHTIIQTLEDLSERVSRVEGKIERLLESHSGRIDLTGDHSSDREADSQRGSNRNDTNSLGGPGRFLDLLQQISSPSMMDASGTPRASMVVRGIALPMRQIGHLTSLLNGIPDAEGDSTEQASPSDLRGENASDATRSYTVDVYTDQNDIQVSGHRRKRPRQRSTVPASSATSSSASSDVVEVESAGPREINRIGRVTFSGDCGGDLSLLLSMKRRLREVTDVGFLDQRIYLMDNMEARATPDDVPNIRRMLDFSSSNSPGKIVLRRRARTLCDVSVKVQGRDSGELRIQVDPLDFVWELKHQLKEHIPNAIVSEMRLIYHGQALQNGRTLLSYQIRGGTTLHAVTRPSRG